MRKKRDVADVAKAATLYYRDKKPKSEIAKELGISATHVANLIKRAHQEEIVTILVDPSRASGPSRQQLLERFHCLRDAIIVPQGDDYGSTSIAVGKAAASYFDTNVKDGANIGIGTSATLFRMVEHIEMKKRVITVVPTLISNMTDCTAKILEADSYTLAAILLFKSQSSSSKAFGTLLPPLVKQDLPNDVGRAVKQLEKESERLLATNEHVRNLYSRMQTTEYDFVFNSCSSLRHPITDQTVVAVLECRGLLRRTLEAAGIVGNVNGLFLDRDLKRAFSSFLPLPLKVLAELARNGSTKVVLAACGAFKADIMNVQLRHGLCNVLITDRATAEELIRMS